ncbi:glucose-6-phosphate isomerase [Aliikangiella sp. G2MR2-5]|uniref:glucose-6-phosphate isomerase n=1 Tax=Aliikangiella sp. G2MR2-5 TaxID=2788943 RepID=UPI0018AA7DBA|nr:glucose-6-phosphate isomerase [Aliikangiella sp. G2MR2-5]
MLISNTKEWKALEAHHQSLADIKTCQLLKDRERNDCLFKGFDKITIDFSKQKISANTLEMLFELALSVNLNEKISGLLSGDKVNTTEDRAALHTALRLPAEKSLILNGEDINSDVQLQLTKMEEIVNRLINGHWRGFSGKPITDVVNLGVGGSDLGPLLVCDALDEYEVQGETGINVHFASTMDGSQISSLFSSLNPETTLFIVVSKSFTTIDTLTNAETAKQWVLEQCSNEALVSKQHFIGVSASPSKMEEWGIVAEHQLLFWEWVGGRFSLWSSVGICIAIKLGMRNFRLLLQGAHEMDKHFLSAEFENNLPVLLGLISIWNVNFRKINAQAILPYDARLAVFPDYLTQLEMESNGKSVTLNGEAVDYDTCPVLWGEVGPNAQHAFYQLLHQGTQKVNCDFIAPVKRFCNTDGEHGKRLKEQHLLTLANCFAQSRALMLGSSSSEGISNKTREESANSTSHRHYPGEQPSTTILLEELSAYSLGQLIALYEHKVYVMAVLWNINPFDQWGVELGKVMAEGTLDALSNKGKVDDFDQSTNKLIRFINSKVKDSGGL